MIVALIATACFGVVERFGPELVAPAAERGWTPAITLTPTAWRWFSAADALEPLRRLTPLPLRSQTRLPSEPKPYPLPDAFVLCPASLNTIAKLALNIADNQALGAAAEALGMGSPFLLAPAVDPTYLRLPVLDTQLDMLRRAGVRVREPMPTPWTALLDELETP